MSFESPTNHTQETPALSAETQQAIENRVAITQNELEEASRSSQDAGTHYEKEVRPYLDNLSPEGLAELDRLLGINDSEISLFIKDTQKKTGQILDADEARQKARKQIIDGFFGHMSDNMTYSSSNISTDHSDLKKILKTLQTNGHLNISDADLESLDTANDTRYTTKRSEEKIAYEHSFYTHLQRNPEYAQRLREQILSGDDFLVEKNNFYTHSSLAIDGDRLVEAQLLTPDEIRNTLNQNIGRSTGEANAALSLFNITKNWTHPELIQIREELFDDRTGTSYEEYRQKIHSGS